MHKKMILKQCTTQRSPEDYAPDGPISKNSAGYERIISFEPLENAIREQLIPALVG